MLTIEKYLALIRDDIRPGVVKPEIGNGVKFKINSNFMRELRHKNFAGTDDEDAYEHVQRVFEIIDLFHFPGVTHDAVMLRVFPITLKGRAMRWKKRLPAGVINTWDLLEKEFIWKYCSPCKTAKKLEEICNFKQEIDETLMLDSRGFITLMTPTQALISIQVMADHSHNWYDETTTKEKSMTALITLMPFKKVSKRHILPRSVLLKKEDKAVEQSSPYRTRKTVCMMENPKEVHKMKAQEDEGDMDVGWDITVEDVETLRQFLIPTIHTLPNLERVVQPYMSLGPVHDKEEIVREEEQDYDIPLHDGVMQPLTPQAVHI
ncbi:ribonuclease H-like domain-containing protein [Tanacetum coccineum]